LRATPDNLSQFTDREILEIHAVEKKLAVKLLSMPKLAGVLGSKIFDGSDPQPVDPQNMKSDEDLPKHESKKKLWKLIDPKVIVSLKKKPDLQKEATTGHPEEPATRRSSNFVPQISTETIETVRNAFRNSKHDSLSFNELSIILMKLRYLLDQTFGARVPEVYYKFLRKYLGTVIRELGAGVVFGERALEGETLRTASVVTVTQCEMIVLGATEYNALVKSSASSKNMDKIRMVHAIFKGSDKLDFETFWQFQYLFQVAARHPEKLRDRRRPRRGRERAVQQDDPHPDRRVRDLQEQVQEDQPGAEGLHREPRQSDAHEHRADGPAARAGRSAPADPRFEVSDWIRRRRPSRQPRRLLF
jgi:CRP-like cAMP-binding protein